MTDLDSFPEEDKHWFMHLGYLAQNWAALEYALDGVARQIHSDFEGGKIPFSFTEKRDYIRSAFSSHPKLARYSEPMGQILEEATAYADIRNWAVHSGIVGNGESATFNRWRKRALEGEQRQLSLHDLFEAATGCARLATTLSIFSRHFFGLQTLDEVECQLREIAGKLGLLLNDETAG